MGREPRKMSEKRKKFLDSVRENKKGYWEYKDSGRLVHRAIAFKEIYLANRKKYHLPFSDYQVHHKDKNKKNNSVENLEVVLPRVHEEKHGKYRIEWAIIHLLVGILFIFVAALIFRGNISLIIISWVVIIIVTYLTTRETKRKKYI